MHFRSWVGLPAGAFPGVLAVAALAAGLAGLVALAPSPSWAADPLPADLEARVRTALAPYAEAGDLSGCVLISRGGEIGAVVPFGFASYEQGVENRPDTRFRIASVSKQFTAAAVLRLEEQGRLAVEDPIAKHLPGFAGNGEITIHQLLTHTSGLGPMESAPEYESARTTPNSLAQLVAMFESLPPTAAPGAGYNYSNAGYVLLAHLVEVVSGEDFGAFLQREVFAPAGLRDTEVDRGVRALPNVASGYDPAGADGRMPAPSLHPSLLTGAGGVVSTVDDIAKWLHSLATDRVLSAASREKMTTAHAGTYGYGVATYDFQGRRVIAHDGRQSGRLADVSYYPDTETAIVFLGNTQSGAGDAIRAALRAAAFGEELPKSVRPVLPGETLPAGEKRPAGAAGFAGVYRFFPGLDVEVRLAAGVLLARANKTGWSELVPTGNGDFFSRVTYAGAGFTEPNDAGETRIMLWKQDGNEFPGERLPEPH